MLVCLRSSHSSIPWEAAPFPSCGILANCCHAFQQEAEYHCRKIKVLLSAELFIQCFLPMALSRKQSNFEIVQIPPFFPHCHRAWLVEILREAWLEPPSVLKNANRSCRWSVWSGAAQGYEYPPPPAVQFHTDQNCICTVVGPKKEKDRQPIFCQSFSL